MASGTIWLESTKSTLQGKIEWSSYSNGTERNSSTVTATLYVARTDWYTTTGTWGFNFNVAGITDSGSSYNSVTGDWVAVSTIVNSNVAHNNDGSGTCYINGSVNGPSGTSMAGQSVSGGQSVTLDSIPRYANITEFRVDSTALQSITIKWNADAWIDTVQYSLNGGGWITTSGKTFTISNLVPNTTYSIKIAVRRGDSGLWSYSNIISGTTKDIARIVQAPNFTLGNSLTITFTNPSGLSTVYAAIYLNDAVTQLAAYRQVSGSSYTFYFTDTELDNIYKNMPGNSLSVRVYLAMRSNGHDYGVYKQCTVTNTGNQKTGHLKVNNSWKRTKHWIKVNGVWKRCIRWIKVNGVWKKCI